MSEIDVEAIVERVVRRVLGASGSSAPRADEVLTQAEAAALASVSTSTIRSWQAQGFLTAGHRGRVSRAELVAFLASPRAKVSTPEEEADAKAAAILARRAARRG